MCKHRRLLSHWTLKGCCFESFSAMTRRIHFINIVLEQNTWRTFSFLFVRIASFFLFFFLFTIIIHYIHKAALKQNIQRMPQTAGRFTLSVCNGVGSWIRHYHCGQQTCYSLDHGEPKSFYLQYLTLKSTKYKVLFLFFLSLSLFFFFTTHFFIFT